MTKKIKKNWKILVAILIILIIGGAWFFNNQQQTKQEVITANPEIKTLEKTLEISGVIDAKEKARLRFLAGGKVVFLGAKEGDSIKKWQTIATIDAASLQKQFDQTMNQYLKERWDYEQYRDDVVENSDGTERVIPDLQTRRLVDKNQWDLENSVLSVEIQNIAIQNTRMVSPIQGVLVSTPVVVAGTQLSPTDYFEVVNPDTLIFRAAIDEVDIGGIKIDQTANISLDAYPEESFTTAVKYIPYSGTLTSSGTVFIIELPIFEASDKGLEYFRLGMNGDALIVLDTVENALVIPIEATRVEDGITYVELLLDSGETEERQITTGLETDDEIQVVSGLTESDTVIIPN